MRLVTSSDIEVETRRQKRRAVAVGLKSLRTLIIKSTLRAFNRALEVMVAPTSAQAVRGQGLQKLAQTYISLIKGDIAFIYFFHYFFGTWAYFSKISFC
jgi:hypothetical protein